MNFYEDKFHRSQEKSTLEKISLMEQLKLNAFALLHAAYYVCRVLLWTFWIRVSKRNVQLSSGNDSQPIKLIDRSPGEHCYVRIKGVKYHYVEAGGKELGSCEGTVVLLGGAPCGWGAAEAWRTIADSLVSHRLRVIIIDPADEAFVEAGELPDMLARVRSVLDAAGVSRSSKNSSRVNAPVRIAGIGLGALVAWYLVLLYEDIFDGVALIGAPHPNLFWDSLPPKGPLNSSWMHFILAGGWRWADRCSEILGEKSGEEAGDQEALTVRGSCAAWRGAARWWRGAAEWRVRGASQLRAPALLVAQAGYETALLSTGELCARPALRMVPQLHSALPDRCKGLRSLLLEFLADSKDRPVKEEQLAKNGRGSSVSNVVGRMLGAVTGSVGAVTSSVRAVATTT